MSLTTFGPFCFAGLPLAPWAFALRIRIATVVALPLTEQGGGFGRTMVLVV